VVDLMATGPTDFDEPTEMQDYGGAESPDPVLVTAEEIDPGLVTAGLENGVSHGFSVEGANNSTNYSDDDNDDNDDNDNDDDNAGIGVDALAEEDQMHNNYNDTTLSPEVLDSGRHLALCTDHWLLTMLVTTEVSGQDYGSIVSNHTEAAEQEAPFYGDLLPSNSDTPVYGDAVVSQPDYAEVDAPRNVPATAVEQGYGVTVDLAQAPVTVQAEYGEIDSPEADGVSEPAPPVVTRPGPPAAEASKLATLATAKVTQLQDKGRPLSLHSPTPSESSTPATPKVWLS
jgi:hypothetical protein